jgi:uncharacterized membrane protein YhaH (DUF805 family)
MCKRREYHRHIPALASDGAYEGRTTRLDAGVAERWAQTSGREERRACRGSGFPWWTLWLIWPLFFVLKAAVATMAGVWSGVLAPFGTAGELPAMVAAVLFFTLMLGPIGFLLYLGVRRLHALEIPLRGGSRPHLRP